MTTRPQHTLEYAWRHGLFHAAVAVMMLLGAAQQESAAQGIFSAGEKLRYKVRWSFIRLGTLETRQCALDPHNPQGRRFILTAKSAAGLPFIDLDLEQTTEATLDSLDLETVTVETRLGGDSKTVCLMQRAAQRMIVIDSCEGALVKLDTVTLVDKCYEALGLLFVARLHASKNERIVLPTLLERSIGETILDFSGQTEKVNVPAIEEPVEAFHVTGDARWVGSSFAGMKGRFCGWISCDEAAIPLRAEIGIALGSIVLELESIDRPQCQPSEAVVLTARQQP